MQELDTKASVSSQNTSAAPPTSASSSVTTGPVSMMGQQRIVITGKYLFACVISFVKLCYYIIKTYLIFWIHSKSRITNLIWRKVIVLQMSALGVKLEPESFTYGSKDVILYALGGRNLMDLGKCLLVIHEQEGSQILHSTESLPVFWLNSCQKKPCQTQNQ